MDAKAFRVRSASRKLQSAMGRGFAALCFMGLTCTGVGYAQPLPSRQGGNYLPAAQANGDAEAAPLAAPRPVAEVAEPTFLPISLETVFRLAEEQNPQIALVRERVREACAEQHLADARWLPDLYVGPAFYRHEGGIQDFNGNLIHSSTGAFFAGMEMNTQFDPREFTYQKVNAQRKLWQQKGELSKVNSEILLEAAGTYIDLLTALTGAAIAADMEKDLRELLGRAEKLAATEPGARVEVARIKAEATGRQQLSLKLRDQAAAASAKLAYLLGVDPCTEMIPIDKQVALIELVDASLPICALVDQALQTGPGIQEMEGLLALIHESIARARGLQTLMPTFGVRLIDGAFGAGPGASSNWDNRLDIGLQARWNLTECMTRRDRQMAAQARIAQAQLAHEDLRSKLTVGVIEARGAIQSGREQVRLGQEQVFEAQRAFKLSDERLRKNLPSSSYSEVLLAIHSLGLAQVNYLSALNAYDKANIRLMVLLGPGAPCVLKSTTGNR